MLFGEGERLGRRLSGHGGIFPLAECDAATRQVVRRHLNRHPVPQQYANVVLAHLARKLGQDLMPVFKPDPELRARQGLNHNAFGPYLVVLFSHKGLLSAYS